METQTATACRLPRQDHWRLIASAIWLSALGVGFASLMSYQSTAGSRGMPTERWPSEVTIAGDRSESTLLFFAHPRCPCTRSSLNELALIIADRPGTRDAKVIFYLPLDSDEEWSNNALVRQARTMQGVEVCWDLDGQLARQFGVETSGHLLLYNAADQLLFSGGITALRNHEGWNVGRSAVIDHGHGRINSTKQTLVFGCPLIEPSTAISIVNIEAQH